MTNLSKLNDLMELRNKLVSEENHIEWYDMMDAMDTEDAAIDELAQEINRLLYALMEKAPAEAAKLRAEFYKIINE